MIAVRKDSQYSGSVDAKNPVSIVSVSFSVTVTDIVTVTATICFMETGFR